MITSPEHRILDLVRRRKIDVTEAERLLAAMGRPRAPRSWSPIERLGIARSLAIGLASAIAVAALSRRAIAVDGFLDLHTIETGRTLRAIVLEQIAAWPAAAAAIVLVLALFRGRVRPLEIFALVGIVRAPYVVAVLAATLAHGRPVVVGVVAFAVVLPAIVLLLVGLWTGIARSSALQGPRLALAFGTAVVAAEAVSKLIVSL